MSEQLETAGETTGPIDGAVEVTTSQWDYIPPPFRDERWEVVGGPAVVLDGFMPIELRVIQSQATYTEFAEQPNEAEAVSAFRRDPSADSRRALQEEYQRGVADGQAQAAHAQQQMAERLNHLLRSIESGREQLYKTIETEALNLSLAIARQVLALTAEVKPEYIVDVVREGLKSLGAAKPLRIRLSSADLEFIHVVGMPAELSEQELGIQYVSDEAIRSGCVIETDFGETDLQLEHMLEQIKETLYEVSR